MDRRLLQQRMKELQSEIEQREATALKVESQVFTMYGLVVCVGHIHHTHQWLENHGHFTFQIGEDAQA